MSSSKRKTVKYLGCLLPTQGNRLSVGNIERYSSSDHAMHRMVRTIIQDLLASAERTIDLKEKASSHCEAMMKVLEAQVNRYFDINIVAAEPHTFLKCETEPCQIDEAVQPKDSKAIKVCRKKISLKSHRGKEKSQSMDFNDEMKRKDKCKEELQILRKCSRNELISIGNNMRSSENEDRSEEIQELLRRKKELLMESKQGPRTHTQASKTTIINEKKEKRFFGQNDEGEVFEFMAKNPVKLQKQPSSAIKLSNIKVLPGQQVFLHSSMRKKPILQMPTTRRTKKRKQIGDTCVLIEQMYEQQPNLDQQQLIQQAFTCKKGVRCVTKDKSMTSMLHLPTIR